MDNNGQQWATMGNNGQQSSVPFFVIEAKFDETHLFVEHILQVPIRIVAWRTIYITDKQRVLKLDY